MSVTVRAKFGSRRLGIAIRKWLVKEPGSCMRLVSGTPVPGARMGWCADRFSVLGCAGFRPQPVGGALINYHLPREIENYIHRAGRTARAGRSGTVINLVTERDGRLMSKLGDIKY